MSKYRLVTRDFLLWGKYRFLQVYTMKVYNIFGFKIKKMKWCFIPNPKNIVNNIGKMLKRSKLLVDTQTIDASIKKYICEPIDNELDILKADKKMKMFTIINEDFDKWFNDINEEIKLRTNSYNAKKEDYYIK